MHWSGPPVCVSCCRRRTHARMAGYPRQLGLHVQNSERTPSCHEFERSCPSRGLLGSLFRSPSPQRACITNLLLSPPHSGMGRKVAPLQLMLRAELILFFCLPASKCMTRHFLISRTAKLSWRKACQYGQWYATQTHAHTWHVPCVKWRVHFRLKSQITVGSNRKPCSRSGIGPKNILLQGRRIWYKKWLGVAVFAPTREVGTKIHLSIATATAVTLQCIKVRGGPKWHCSCDALFD